MADRLGAVKRMPELFSGPIVARAILWSVIALGLAVRLVGASYDLPLITHPDEYRIVDAVVDMFERRSFEPIEFTWPAHIVIMAGYFSGTAYSYLVLGMGPEAAISEVGIEHWYLSTRIAVGLIGTAGIIISYFIGKQFNQTIGLISAILIAFFPPFVSYAHYATTDITLTTIVLAIVLVAISYLDSPRYPQLIGMSFLVAMAIATKYPGLIAAGMIAVVVAIRAIQDRTWSRFFAHGIVSLISLGVSLFLVSPKLITERGMVLRSLTNESRPNHLGADGFNFVEKLGFYITSYIDQSGWILLVAFVAGVVAIIRFRLVRAVPLFIGVIFWIALSTLGLHWFRWGMPMYVTGLLVSAVGVYYLIDAVRTKKPEWRRITAPALVAVSVVVTANLVATSVGAGATAQATDVRAIAVEDFEARGITPENSVYEGYTPASLNFPQSMFGHFEQTDNELIPPEGIEYAVLSSAMYGRYMADSRYETQQRFYELLDEQFELVVEYTPSGLSPRSANPLVNIVNQVRNIVSVAQGEAVDGAVIKVYRIGTKDSATR